MASSLSAVTNHNLHLAKLLLQQLEQALRLENARESLLLDAYGQAVVWHLQRTVESLIMELTDRARMPLDQARHRVLHGSIDDVDTLPAELREVAVLYRQAWLGDMMRAERLKSYQKPSKHASQSIVAVHEVADNFFGLAELQAWFTHFDQLLDRFRETTVEW